MRKKVGMMITMIGIIFCLYPNFDIRQMIEKLQFEYKRYWPVVFIVIGIYLQRFQLYHERSKKRKKVSHKRLRKA